MDKFLIRKPIVPDDEFSKQSCLDLKLLPADPGLRKSIFEFHPNDRDEVRRAYLLKGPCQPRGHRFNKKNIGGVLRRFNPKWFDQYKNWLEYSIQKEAAFCLCCYLFKPDNGKQAGGDSFIGEGFSAWNKKERLNIHVGDCNSVHNQALRKCQDLMKQNQHIEYAMWKQSEQVKSEYRIRLTASVDCIRFLLRQGLAFRGHDESEDSSNKGNFLELLQFLADQNEDIGKVVLRNTPGNLKLVSPKIQKDIVSAAAKETTKVIIEDLGDDFFTILVDESCDISIKEQMVVVLRYVNKRGSVVERFLGIVHVTDTTALSLKKAIETLLSEHGLSLTKVRGQGYDGASNMQGEYNGLKTLILKENKSAFYIHCFAHQLQLTLVAVAKNHTEVSSLFSVISNLLNVVGVSCKRQDILREKQAKRVIEALNNGELQSGQGLNQESSLKRAGDTRWGSHYGTLLNIIVLFSSIIDVLEVIEDDAAISDKKGEAHNLLELILTFDFVFSLHLMKNVLGVTNELSVALQRKEQDIVNAMKLVKVSKQRLQMMRDDGWEYLIDEVSSFCNAHNIHVPNMEDLFVARGRSRRKASQITNLHHYHVEIFYTVIDMQLLELNHRFSESSTELLLCVACLSPHDSFCAFDKKMLVRLAQFYPGEFSPVDLLALENELGTYIVDMRSDDRFDNLKGMAELAQTLMETKKNIVYPLVFLVIKLALVLPVATATVERAFSAMKIIKNRLRNRMADEWMNDCLVTYVEKDVFENVGNESIIRYFQNMKNRRGQL